MLFALHVPRLFGRAALVFCTACAALPTLASATQATDTAAPGSLTPSGQMITPLAAPDAAFAQLDPGLKAFPQFRASGAVSSVISPDGDTLLVLTSGYNLIYGAHAKPIPADSGQYVFVYDIRHGEPRQTQTLKVPQTYMGIAFAPDGRRFYVSGGDDDNVHIFARQRGRWAESGKPIALGHRVNASKYAINQGGVGLLVTPEAGALAVTADGRTVVVANYYNDSLSLIDTASRRVREIPLRPGIIDPQRSGMAGGEYPAWIVVHGSDLAYVSSQRDREIDVVALGDHPRVLHRISVPGNPNRMVLDASGKRLYVACDNEAALAVIDTDQARLVDTVNVTAPSNLAAAPAFVHGTVPNSVAMSPDGSRLYVSDAGINALAVVAINTPRPQVVGLIPTGYYPNSVSVSHDSKRLYVVNGKSMQGPNPQYCLTDTYDLKRQARCRGRNDYILQLSRAGLLSLPVPTLEQLQRLTHTVASNNHFSFEESDADRQMMAFLHQHIRHVIYVVRENRSYDQILGDIGKGNADPDLVEFGQAVTPNAHALADEFVDLDNFYDTGEVSGNGWAWSTAARESDPGAKNNPVNYADGGLSYDWEGSNRNVDVALPTLAARRQADPYYPDKPNLLPGQNDVAAPDGPHGERQQGYLWDAALRAGLSVRNYGFFIDLNRYPRPVRRGGVPLLAAPYASHTTVAVSTNPILAPRTDPYFRGFDNRFPDYYRENEWAREFARYVTNKNLPALELVRLMHDHLGNFRDAIKQVDTPETEVADNDYALGRLIEAVARSPYADSTLIFVVEDDAQDGPDHVDAHRSVAFIVGPYVKHQAVVSARYSTVNMIRTIEDVLGFGPMTLNDAYERPMTAAFDRDQPRWSFSAVEPAPLTATDLPQTTQASALPRWHSSHPARWWAQRTRGYDWSVEDHIPTLDFDHLIWRGLRAGQPYPHTLGVTAGQPDAEGDGD